MGLEVRTRTRITEKHGAELLMEIVFIPRGSGNRKRSQELARAARKNEQLAPHVRKVVAGTSKVSIYFRASAELMKVIWAWPTEPKDVEGQLPLFRGSALPA